MSTLKQIMIKNIIAPTYHGIVRRKKPNINLHIAKNIELTINIYVRGL
jgi:hypothetical protein